MAQAGPTTVLIGWSYGGMLAIESAVKEPDRFKAIVLVGCSAKFTDGMNPIIIKNIRRGLNRYFEETMRNCYGTFFLTGEAAFMKEFIEEQILPDPKETIRMLERLLVMDLRSSLKDITTPTLIIHGDQDEICPLAAGEFLHKGIQGSRLAVIGGAGHMPFYTQPAEFNNIVENFLNGLK